MKPVGSKLDRIIVLCRSLHRTASLYTETLGLKVCLQSDTLYQLRDQANLPLILRTAPMASQLSKGYSPLLCFRVANFKDVHDKMTRWQLLRDGEVQQLTGGSKLAVFIGLEGETICIHDMPDQEQKPEETSKSESPGDQQIRNLLARLKNQQL